MKSLLSNLREDDKAYDGWRATLRALFVPRRLFAILVVGMAIVWAQHHLSVDRFAVPFALGVCVAFLLVGPASYRALFPHELRIGERFLRSISFISVAVAIIFVLGKWLPDMLHRKEMLLSSRPILYASVALFLVGSWGLGRDINMERGLVLAGERMNELSKQREQAELLALRNHFDPHFLFNTLGAIAEWCREDGLIAEKAIVQLSQMLRLILEGIKEESWELERELDLAKDLFELHLIRDPEAFTITTDIVSPVPKLLVPPMLLLPLMENAMKHGPRAGNKGPVCVRVFHEHDEVVIVIENQGQFNGPREGGHGLDIFSKRLAHLGHTSHYEIHSKDGKTIVEVRIALLANSAQRSPLKHQESIATR